jgi:2-dehydro-3-deoxyglucarate aldolase
MKLIISKCKEYNIPCGEHIVEPNPDKLNMRIDQGYRFIAYGTDAVFLFSSSINPLKNESSR